MKPSSPRSKLVFFTAAMLTCVMGCASPIALEAGPKTPAAAGNVKLSRDGQGNTKIDLKVNYLPQPFELDRSLTTFVVWSIADDGNRVRNLGQLQVDSHRHGSVDLVTPLSRFTLLVTAEQSGTAEKPSDYLILQGNINPS
jgi:hypothetical protein